MTATHQLFCAPCDVSLELLTDTKPDETVRCPNCGVVDTLENATNEAVEHRLNDAMKGISASTSGNSFVKITVKHLDDGKAVRFILKDKAP